MQWPTNLVGWYQQICYDGNFPYSTLWSHGPARSRDQLKPNLAWWWLTLMGSYRYSHLTLLSQITWQTKDISLLLQYLWPQLGKVLTYDEELPLIKLLDPYITRFCEVTWHIKYFKCPVSIDQWPPNMARWWITMRGFLL